VLTNKGQDAFADAQGFFRLARLEPGTYSVRARQIGYSPKDTTIIIARGASVTGLTFRLAPIALPLPSIVVKPGACVNPGVPDSATDPALAGVFAQVRENVDRFRIVLDEYPFRYARQDSAVFRPKNGADHTLLVDTALYESRARKVYRVGQVLFTEPDAHGKPVQYMFLPSFPDLADSSFLATHCWTWGGVGTLGGRSTDPMLIVHFVPADSIRTPDVAGSIYLDSTRLVVRRATYRLTKESVARPPVIGLTVTTSYREFVPLVPYIDSIVTSRVVNPGSLIPVTHGGATGHQTLVAIGAGSLIEFARMLHYGFEGEAPGGIQGTEPAKPGTKPVAVATTAAATSPSWTAPSVPADLRRYHLDKGPITDPASPGVTYWYGRGQDSIEVSLSPYDPMDNLFATGDTLDLLDNEYSTALDSLRSLADQNAVTFVDFSDGENHLQIGGRNYLGIAFRWTWQDRKMGRTGCDPSFLKGSAIRFGWSCYQQTYALPQGLLRIRSELYGGETVSTSEVAVFTNELVAAIVGGRGGR
jgi:hypothetical protein